MCPAAVMAAAWRAASVMVSVGKHDRGPGVGQHLCDAKTDAAGRTGDDRDLTGEAEQAIEAVCQR